MAFFIRDFEADTSSSSAPKARRLHPITSISTSRYQRYAKVQLSHKRIPAVSKIGNNPSPPYLPEQWTAYTHPEGQLYFCRHSHFRVITEAYLYSKENLHHLSFWIQWVESLCRERNVVISEDVELFLQLEESGCGYYFIDHASRTEFWLEDLETEELGIPEVASDNHLKLALEQHYWSHVERFPMHFGGLSTKVVDELLCILSYGQIDRMTSSLSTFPYSPEEFTKYIKLVAASRDLIADGHATCIVARLWTIVANHRFTTHFGDEHSRLSRDQSIVHTVQDDIDCGKRIPWLVSRLSFSISDQYLSKIRDIFVDDLVYIDQWQKFMATCFRDWRLSSANAFALLILHAPLFWIRSSVWLSLASSIILVASLIASALLMFRHEPFLDVTAGEAASYLLMIRSDKYNFYPLAFVYSIPRALNVWGLCILLFHTFCLIALQFGFTGAFILIGFILTVIVGIQRITSTHPGSFLCLDCSGSTPESKEMV